MNILTAEMQYQNTFFIIPQVTVRLGKSWKVSLKWLNFELEAKHISTDLNNTNIFIHTPYVTLTSYMQSAYRLTFDLCWLGYTYRRGIWLKDGVEPRPADIEQIINGFRDALVKIKEEMEKE